MLNQTEPSYSTEDQPSKPRMSLPAVLFFAALFFGSAIFFALRGDLVIAGAMVMIGFCSFAGFRSGASTMLAGLVAIGAAIALAPAIGVAQEWRFSEWFGTTGLTNRLISVVTVGVLISIVVTSVLLIIAGRVLASRPRAAAINRWLGFLVGGVEGIAVVTIFLGGLLVLEPIEQQRADQRDRLDERGRLVSRLILDVSGAIHDSAIGPQLVANNPFTTIPQLNRIEEVQQTAIVLSDPEQIDHLLHHPAIERLQQRPEMRQAVDRLNRDPEIQQILQSGQRLDRDAALTLMNHPVVLDLIDQPGFMDEAYEVIRQSAITR